MPYGLKRFQKAEGLHFNTFSAVAATRRLRRLSRLSQRYRVGTRWESKLPSRIVRGTPHHLGHV
jgi:hypothetical protein